MRKLIIATKNKGKAKEFAYFFQRYEIEAISLLDIEPHAPEVEETGTTFMENAALKAETISKRYDKPVLADDSGLIIDAIDGRPGIFSARYAGEPKDDLKNMLKVLTELKDIPEERRTARFICVLALAIPKQKTIFKIGYCEGRITMMEKGDNGFGYDPIFVPDGLTKTMAELSSVEKSEISHRKRAMDQLDEWLRNNNGEGFHA